MTKNKFTVPDICLIGVFTALTVIMAQITIQMPLGVPLTMQTFSISFAAIMLGSRRGFMSVLVYILLGAFGLPVFQSFTGGLGVVFGPTGGFILSFPVMAWMIGLGAEKQGKLSLVAGLVCGTVVNYIGGMLMFSAVTGRSLYEAWLACVLPFIPTAVIKAFAAALLGVKLKSRLSFIQRKTTG
ncbi:MAG: biotin transporter BioY [Oscillospiraceae bacterium]|nr:biotin transporter BioY [Oscillospiraceae bacterium]